MTRNTRAYWNGIAVEWAKSNAFVLWRAYSDAVNSALFMDWTDSQRAMRLLKTDLFDEAVATGIYPSMVAKAEAVIGIDLSPLTVAAAHERCLGLSASCGDVRALPFADCTFDFVFSNSTLDHFDSRHEIATSLNEIHRLLRPGGRLLLTLDNLANPAVAIRNGLPFALLNRLGIVPYRVGVTLGPHGLAQAVKEADFKVQKIDAVMHCPRLPSVLISRILQRWIDDKNKRRLLDLMLAFERLGHLPTRFLTGYFCVVHANKI